MDIISGTAMMMMIVLTAYLPVGDFITGGGHIIPYESVGSGVNYQLQRNNSNEGSPVAGTGNPLNFGSFTQNGDYTVIATNATTNCQSNMNGTVSKGGGTEPTKFNVTGGGSYCTGGPGLPVGLDDTETGVSYQLYLDNVAVGSPIAGTGNAISFGNQTGTGTYTVIGTRTNGSGCAATMNGSVQISLDLTAPTITSVTGTTLTLGCNPSASDINAALGTATATDAVSTPTVSASMHQLLVLVQNHRQEHLQQEMHVVILQQQQEQ
jgi:hypothetical protein